MLFIVIAKHAIAVVCKSMAGNFGHLVRSLLKSLQLHGTGLFDVFYAYLLARIVIFCHCLMNLCLTLSMFVKDLLVLFCLALNQSLRLFVW